MTVSTETITHSYYPGSAMQPEGIPFQFLDGEHLRVGIAGLEDPLVAGTDYVISGDGRTAQGIITALRVYADDALVMLERITPRVQQALTEPFKALPAEATGRSLDQRAMVEQELDDAIARSPLLPRNGGVEGMFPVALPGRKWGWASGMGADDALRGDMATPGDGTGADLSAYRQSGDGAIDQTVQDALRRSVYGADYGVGSGGNDAARLAKAFARASALGVPLRAAASPIALAADYAAPAGSYVYFPRGASYSGAGRIENAVEEWEFFRQGTKGANYTQSKPRIGRLFKRGDDYGPDQWQGNWSVSPTYWQYSDYEWMFYREFDQNSDVAPNGWPQATVCHMAVSKNGNRDFVAATHSIAVCAADYGSAWCENNIALSGFDPYTSLAANITFITCGEDDMQPSQSANVLGGAGRLINSFWSEVPFAGLAIAKDAGGGFAQGIWIEGVTAAGTGIQFAGGATMATGIDLSFTHFTAGAIALGNDAPIRFKKAGGSNGFRMEGDSTGNPKVFLENSGTAFKIVPVAETQGEAVLAVELPTSFIQPFVAYAATGGTINGAAAAVKIRSNSTTGRSGGVAGTWNVGGADYAEYERKRADCGTVAKGQVIGFDSEGLLTDRWDLAISFAVKSTDPNLVGGDRWCDELGERPIQPELVIAVQWDGGARPVGSRNNPAKLWDGGPRPEQAGAVRDAWDAARRAYDAEWSATLKERQEKWDADRAIYDAAVAEEIAAYEAGPLAAWKIVVDAWDAEHEVLRQAVDRIAYCGKVPLNLTGAQPGQYVLAVDDGGAIGCVAKDHSDTTADERDLFCVGRVRRVLQDGRAEIVVRPV